MPERVRELRAGESISEGWVRTVARGINRWNAYGFPDGGLAVQTVASAAQRGRVLTIETLYVSELIDENYGTYKARRRYYRPSMLDWFDGEDEDHEWEVDAFSVGDNFVLLVGDSIMAIWHEQAGQFVPLNAPMERRGVADSEIVVGSSGVVSLWRHDGDALVDTERNLIAHLDWMHGSDTDNNISAGKQVIVRYFVDSRRWTIVAAECET